MLSGLREVGANSPVRGMCFLLRGSRVLSDLRSCHVLSTGFPVLSEFFPGYFEFELLTSTSLRPLVWLIYVNDVFAVTSCRSRSGMGSQRQTLLLGYPGSSPCWSLARLSIPGSWPSVMCICFFTIHSSQVKRSRYLCFFSRIFNPHFLNEEIG